LEEEFWAAAWEVEIPQNTYFKIRRNNRKEGSPGVLNRGPTHECGASRGKGEGTLKNLLHNKTNTIGQVERGKWVKKHPFRIKGRLTKNW